MDDPLTSAEPGNSSPITDTVWPTRLAFTVVALVVVLFGVIVLVPAYISHGLALWGLICAIWAVGILLTWMSGRIANPSTSGGQPPKPTQFDPK